MTHNSPPEPPVSPPPPEDSGSQADSRILRRKPRQRGQHLARTIVLGAVAVFVAIYWLASEFDMDREELLGYAGTSLLLTGAAVGLAIIGAALLWLVKRWFR